MRKRGFSLIEFMVAAAIAGVMLAVAVPNFVALLEVYRRDGAVQQLTGDLRKARSEAIKRGWQYRILGYSAGASGQYANQYRMLGRSSGAVAWPTDATAAFESDTQLARAWVNIGTTYRGVRMNPSSSASFAAAFDSRGVRVEVSGPIDPLVVAGPSGPTKSVRVSLVGNVRIE